MVEAPGVLEEGGSVTFRVTYEARVSGEDPDQLEAHLDAVMEELLALGATDPDIGASLAQRQVEISVAVVGVADPEEAVRRAGALIRTAIHAAGGATPDWPAPKRPRKATTWSLDLLAVLARKSGSDLMKASAGDAAQP
jgi:hypothetical protein